MTKHVSIDNYIDRQDDDIAKRLSVIRQLFHKVIPATQESIRYGMPAFTVGGHHLYLSAFKNHIGMYPMYGISELDADMMPYRGRDTKDALHFKHNEPLPVELIEKIIVAKNTKCAV